MRKLKKSGTEVEHKTFGIGSVKHRKITDYGDAVVIEFTDKVRTILVASDGWANPDDAEAAFKTAPAEQKPKEKVKPIRVRPADETVEVGDRE
jgi:hypothetical protein